MTDLSESAILHPIGYNADQMTIYFDKLKLTGRELQQPKVW